jgi:uncharacterized membrane-anchored protein
MPKPKLYFKWDIPTSIVDIVKAICADYDRRERTIKFGTISGAVLERYIELNNAVDKALQDVEIGLRNYLLSDIRYNRGYDYSDAQEIIAKNTYYNRKRKLIHDIAIELKLL